MLAVLARCSEYPDDEASTLRLKLAEHHSVKVEQILVAGGLTEFLGMLARAFLPGLNAVTSQRSFIVYRLATEAAGAAIDRSSDAPERIRSRPELPLPLTAIPGSFFWRIPTIPTGTMATADDVDHLLDHVPEQVVVLDEAYYEFAQDFAARRVSRIRVPLITCAREETLWCCARFPRYTGWPERGSGTGSRPKN